MIKILTIIVGAVALVMSGYLFNLVDQTNFFDRVVELPEERIWQFHIAAAVVIMWLVYSLMQKALPPLILIGLLVLAVGTEGMFLGLNFNGTIVEQSELMQKIEAGAEELKEKAEELLGN
jgi:hypothetical protein